MTLAQWQVRYEALLVGHRALAEAAQVHGKSLSKMAFDLTKSGPCGSAAWDGLEEQDRKDEAWRLLEDLAAIEPPPTVDSLQSLVDKLVEDQTRSPSRFPEIEQWRRERKARLLRWIAESDGCARDTATGIPLDLIEAERTIADETLGDFPVALGAARARAWLKSSADDRSVAAGFARDPSWTEAEWRVREATSNLSAAVLREFFGWLDRSDDPSAESVMREWHDGSLRDQVRAFLDRNEVP